MDDRVTELELRFMQQQEVVETLNKELIERAKKIDELEGRVKRIETALEDVLRSVFVPANEKPPHY